METATTENFEGINKSTTGGALLSEGEIRKRLSAMTIVKRNGTLVPFRRDRIATAIEAAFRDVQKISKTAPLPQATYTLVQTAHARSDP